MQQALPHLGICFCVQALLIAMKSTAMQLQVAAVGLLLKLLSDGAFGEQSVVCWGMTWCGTLLSQLSWVQPNA